MPYFVFGQINLGLISVYTWGLLVGLGFSAGYLLLLHSAKNKNLPPEKIAGLALAIFLGGILGAKNLSLISLPGGIFNNINLFFSQDSGAMFMGGLVGSILLGGIYIKLAGLVFWEIADLLVLPTALGIAIGRIGCILINDHQGAVTNLPWGILWPDGLLRHPVGVYESLAGLILFGIFWWIRKREFVTTNGLLSLFFLAAYGAIRFLLDFTRESSGVLADPRWGLFSVSQWLALLLVFFSVAIARLLKSGKRQA